MVRKSTWFGKGEGKKVQSHSELTSWVIKEPPTRRLANSLLAPRAQENSRATSRSRVEASKAEDNKAAILNVSAACTHCNFKNGWRGGSLAAVWIQSGKIVNNVILICWSLWRHKIECPSGIKHVFVAPQGSEPACQQTAKSSKFYRKWRPVLGHNLSDWLSFVPCKDWLEQLHSYWYF